MSSSYDSVPFKGGRTLIQLQTNEIFHGFHKAIGRSIESLVGRGRIDDVGLVPGRRQLDEIDLANDSSSLEGGLTT